MGHLGIGVLRHFHNSSFATIRIVNLKCDPPSFHALVFELPSLPIVFPPTSSRFDGRGTLTTTLRLMGDAGKHFQQLYQRLLHAVAFALSVDDNAWKALDWNEDEMPRPSQEQLLSWAKGVITEDRMRPGHFLLRIRLPNGPKPFLLTDERDVLMEDGREPEELPTCLPQSLLPYQQLHGLLSVSDLWIQMRASSSEDEETEEDAARPLQWGVTLTAKQLTVRPAQFEEEELQHGREEEDEQCPLEDLEAFEQQHTA
jgi:hypothetical protein